MTRAPILVAALIAVACTAADAQNLAGRIANAPDGRIQFSYPARAGVCGNGRSFITIDDSHYGSFVSNDGIVRERCEPGPVRVVLDKADRTVVAVHTYVGPVDTAAAPATDLGTVGAREASDYLLRVAATMEGRPGRDAIMPAAIAAGVDVSPRLLAIARDDARPVETRRTALSWIARGATTADEARRTAATLVEIARDGDEPRQVREQALSVLSRLAAGAGIPQVIALTRGPDEWLVRSAVATLARSGDPRARGALREIVQQASLPDATLTVALRGLGGTYATAADAALLRSAYTRVSGEASRRQIISAIAELGGGENVRWLLAIARDQGERETLRRSALSGARRAGATSDQLAGLYDTGDNTMRGLVVSALAENVDKAAVDKLLAIARSGDDRAIRRRAVSALSKVDDPRVKAALAEIVAR